MAYKDEPDAEGLPDDEEQLINDGFDDGIKGHASVPASGMSYRKKLGIFFAYTWFLAIVVYVAFHQGYVVLAGSESEAAASSSSSTTGTGSAWSVAQLEAEKLLSGTASRDSISCLNADISKTKAIIKDALAGKYTTNANTATPRGMKASKVPLPALNLGMPKCGTTSQSDFFRCAGYKATHSILKDNSHQGLCMRDASRADLKPLETCTQGTDALTEMDSHSAFGIPYTQGGYESNAMRNDCFFPQLSLLEQIHEDDPNATFLLAFRPVEDWVDSVMNWGDGFGIEEMSACDLPNSPRGVPDLSLSKEDTYAHMAQFICSHVIHVRNFVEAHPTHALIEYDLYDKPTTASFLGQIFPSVKTGGDSSDCWQHVSHKTDIHQGDKVVSF